MRYSYDMESLPHDEHSPYEIKTLLSWHAPARPFKKRKKQFYLNMFLLILPLEIIGFLFHLSLLMTVIVAFAFFVAVLYTVPPHMVYIKISTEGITADQHFYLWQELYDFYFKKLHNEDILVIRTQEGIANEIIITLGNIDKSHLQTILLPYLPYREYVKPTFVEKSGDWLARTFPLE